MDATFEKKATTGPPTAAQMVWDNYVAKVLEDKVEQDISEEERVATIKCLMKVMKFQETSIKN